jgi:AraC-like DNA-binding protein
VFGGWVKGGVNDPLEIAQLPILTTIYAALPLLTRRADPWSLGSPGEMNASADVPTYPEAMPSERFRFANEIVFKPRSAKMLDLIETRSVGDVTDYRSSLPRRPAKIEEGAFGPRIAAHLRPDAAHPVGVRTLSKPQLIVTRLTCDTGLTQISTPIPSQKAFIINLQLREIPFHELWLDGKHEPTGPYPKGGISILDLEQNPTAFLPTAFDVMQFYLTRADLDELSDDCGCRRVETLSWKRGEIDPITNHIAMTFVPALERPDQASKLFLDHAALALKTHFAHAYGEMRPPDCIRGGLAPWQERRSKELMNSRLEEDISLAELASECRLSRSYFARAFKQTTGEAPHRWLMRRRVETAKRMLLQSDLPLSEIALAVGFADQSHLTKVFSRAVGATPGAWRRGLKQ